MPELEHAFRAAAYAPASDEEIITLLTIEHDDLPATLRFSSHPTERLSHDPTVQGTVHDGEEYLHRIVSDTAPTRNAGALPDATIVLQNVEGALDVLDELTLEDMIATVIEVLKSDPEIVVRQFVAFSVAAVTTEDLQASLHLGLAAVEDERFPTHGMSKSRTPAIFR